MIPSEAERSWQSDQKNIQDSYDNQRGVYMNSPLTTITENDSLMYTNSTQSSKSMDRNVDMKQLEEDRRDLEQLTMDLGRGPPSSMKMADRREKGRGHPPHPPQRHHPYRQQTPENRSSRPRRSHLTVHTSPIEAHVPDPHRGHPDPRAVRHSEDHRQEYIPAGPSMEDLAIEIHDDGDIALGEYFENSTESWLEDLPPEEKTAWKSMLRNQERRMLDQIPRHMRLAQRAGSPLGLTLEELDDRGFLDGTPASHLQSSREASPLRYEYGDTEPELAEAVDQRPMYQDEEQGLSPPSPEEYTKRQRRALEMRKRSARLEKRQEREQTYRQELSGHERSGRPSSAASNHSRREVRTPSGRRNLDPYGLGHARYGGRQLERPVSAKASSSSRPYGHKRPMSASARGTSPNEREEYTRGRPVQQLHTNQHVDRPQMSFPVAPTAENPPKVTDYPIYSSQFQNGDLGVDGGPEVGRGRSLLREEGGRRGAKRPMSAAARVMHSTGWESQRPDDSRGRIQKSARASDLDSDISGIVDDDDDDNTIEEEFARALENQYTPQKAMALQLSTEELKPYMTSQVPIIEGQPIRVGTGGYVEIPEAVPVPVLGAQYQPGAVGPGHKSSTSFDSFATSISYQAQGISEKVEAAANTLRSMIVQRQAEVNRSLHQIFNHFDRRNCGYFDVEDLDDALQDLCISLLPKEVTDLIRVMAQDGFERVSFGEFAVFVTDPHWAVLEGSICTQLAAQLLAHGRSFRLLDPFLTMTGLRKDPSLRQGVIPKDRFLAGLAGLGLHLTANEAQRVLVRFDVHGTGACSFNRFVRAVERSPQWKAANTKIAEQEQVIEEAELVRLQFRNEGEYPSNLTDEVVDMCEYLGIRILSDRHCVWIAEEALQAPIPDGWELSTDVEGRRFYFHPDSGVSRWDHPLDNHYRMLYFQHRRQPPSPRTQAKWQDSSADRKSESEEKSAQAKKAKRGRWSRKRFEDAKQYAEDLGYGEALSPARLPPSRQRPQVSDYTSEAAMSMYYQRKSNNSIPQQHRQTMTSNPASRGNSNQSSPQSSPRNVNYEVEVPDSQMTKPKIPVDEPRKKTAPQSKPQHRPKRPMSAQAMLPSPGASGTGTYPSHSNHPTSRPQRPRSAKAMLQHQGTGEPTVESQSSKQGRYASDSGVEDDNYYSSADHQVYDSEEAKQNNLKIDKDDDSDADSLIDNYLAMYRMAPMFMSEAQHGRPHSAVVTSPSPIRSNEGRGFKKSSSLADQNQGQAHLTKNLEDHIASLENRIKELELLSPRLGSTTEKDLYGATDKYSAPLHRGRRSQGAKKKKKRQPHYSSSRVSEDFMPFSNTKHANSRPPPGNTGGNSRKGSTVVSRGGRSKGGIVLI